MPRAIQFDGTNYEDVIYFSEQGEIVLANREGDEVDDDGKVQYTGTLRVHTPTGIVTVNEGDWIVDSDSAYHVASGFLPKESDAEAKSTCCPEKDGVNQ